MRIRIQRWVNESHGRLANSEPFLVDAIDDGCKDGRRRRGAPYVGELAITYANGDIVS